MKGPAVIPRLVKTSGHSLANTHSLTYISIRPNISPMPEATKITLSCLVVIMMLGKATTMNRMKIRQKSRFALVVGGSFDEISARISPERIVFLFCLFVFIFPCPTSGGERVHRSTARLGILQFLRAAPAVFTARVFRNVLHKLFVVLC